MKAQGVKPLVGVVLGNADTPSAAAQIAGTYGKCPYCASFQSTGNSAMGIFTLPPDRRWWLDGIGETPLINMGLNNAETVFTEAIDASSPWSRGEVNPNLHPAPCGRDCRRCPCYGGQCKGCPSTLNYLGD